ncbi:DUF5681 domain-containing protein [Xanthomonas sp. NCPPB 1067]|uniref:DUF5681 domain-containing protein n=1 Tax=Xanthomonas sp. NCPPB 1067 TaxID=487524 RepID=UPI001E3E1DDD|nr:DUF5681 domain-containing protein [Xanthomonas sp. NCPPB 1067]MCC4588164.1 DUF5681 domain-containing protein [Xanthomonas sp. NCPPB 1067]
MAEVESPEWMKGFVPQPNKPPRGWQPGQSGNPAGRPKGSKNRKTQLAEELQKDGSDLARVIKEAALAGDTSALNLWAQRLEPPLRARAATVESELDPDKPLHEQAQQVLAAVSEGRVDPETGRMLIDCIQSVAGIRAVDELEARLAALEEKQA